MVEITPYIEEHRAAIIDLSLRAWAPVFPQLRASVPNFVYQSFYPVGWQERQRTDIGQILDDQAQTVDIAMIEGVPVGWVSTQMHPEDSMGEIYVLAVDPQHQHRGIGRALIEHSMNRIRQAGMNMAMVETGDDPGHESARALYEAQGFERWPVARYFKEL